MSSNNFCKESDEKLVAISTSSKERKGRFLGPIISEEFSPPTRPSQPISTIASPFALLENLKFLGWVKPQQKWREWVNIMRSINSATWTAAGINDAIMNSVIKIPQNKSQILWFAEKWSPQTNTFIVPWGKISITLEDMMVLGGFSVLGDPATCHVESPEECDALNELNKAYKELIRLIRSPKKAVFSGWITMFMGTHEAYEHEAFLAFWLSKYLFPSMKNTIIHFVWRPYVENTNHFFAHTIYNENESHRRIDNEELDSFARCLRPSKLVGLDVIQRYFPHRVCKQFGYDQDIPADVLQLEDDEDAWADYATPLSNKILYLPS